MLRCVCDRASHLKYTTFIFKISSSFFGYYIMINLFLDTPVLEISHLGVRTWNFLFESDAENIMFVKKMTELIDKAMAKAYQRYSQLMDGKDRE